jgi:integrase
MTKLPSGVKTVRSKLKDGSEKVFYYHRASGTRLPGEPSDPDFIRILDKLNRETIEQKLRVPVEDISWLIREYMESRDWKDLAQSTRDVESYNIDAIERKFGSMPLAAVEERGARDVLLKWHSSLADDHPRAADAKLARLAKIFAFALDRQKIVVNPLATFKRAYAGDRSDKIWLPEHVEAFRSVGSERLTLAMELALHTGQRQGDILAVGPGQYDGQGLDIVQGKTGRRVYIPCTSALKQTLDALPKERGTFVRTFRNKPYRSDNFRLQWRQTADKSFGPDHDLHYHDLRGTAITMLAEAGCTVPEIASITGHTYDSVNKILEKYLPRTKTLALAAIAKLEARNNQEHGPERTVIPFRAA